MSATFTKDPSATLDYTIDWTAWLGSDQIIAAAWAVPADLTNVKNTYSLSTATIWLSGGAAGITYYVDCEISTDQGRIDSRQLTINVEQK